MEDRRNSRKAVLLILGTIVLLALAVFLGIPVLVKMAIFFGDLKSSKTPVDKNDLVPPPRPAFCYLMTPQTAPGKQFPAVPKRDRRYI